MYIGFSRFLVALAVVGVALGATFGGGVAVGRGNRPAQALAANTSSGANAASSANAAGGGGGAGAGGAGAGAGGAGAGAGGNIVNGQVDTISSTSMTVRSASGQSVTLTLNPQTAVRKTDAGTLADVHVGDEVLVTHDASSVATAVQLVPVGTTFGRGGAAQGAGASASATATRTAGTRGTTTP